MVDGWFFDGIVMTSRRAGRAGRAGKQVGQAGRQPRRWWVRDESNVLVLRLYDELICRFGHQNHLGDLPQLDSTARLLSYTAVAVHTVMSLGFNQASRPHNPPLPSPTRPHHCHDPNLAHLAR